MLRAMAVCFAIIMYSVQVTPQKIKDAEILIGGSGECTPAISVQLPILYILLMRTPTRDFPYLQGVAYVFDNAEAYLVCDESGNNPTIIRCREVRHVHHDVSLHFESKKDLEHYLSRNKVGSGMVIDLKAGKIFDVEQEDITTPEVVEKVVGYKLHLKDTTRTR